MNDPRTIQDPATPVFNIRRIDVGYFILSTKEDGEGNILDMKRIASVTPEEAHRHFLNWLGSNSITAAPDIDDAPHAIAPDRSRPE